MFRKQGSLKSTFQYPVARRQIPYKPVSTSYPTNEIGIRTWSSQREGGKYKFPMNLNWFIPAFLQSVKANWNMGQICSILPCRIPQAMFPGLQPLPGDPCLFVVYPPPLLFHGLPLMIHLDTKLLVLALFGGPCIPQPIVVFLFAIPAPLLGFVVCRVEEWIQGVPKVQKNR